MKSKPNRLKLEYPAPPESPIVSLAANKVCTDMYSTCGKIFCIKHFIGGLKFSILWVQFLYAVVAEMDILVTEIIE
eukprot:CAMPEP_0117894442 /NCGR_PEP_ID=MMETSP0950-20121206/25957_1 /TAXON_ID=44440 /ORGANISM="Chattonella subsalsa, Strain CCMP2191" /LENGTH=75 /DNA_ID=CAMNT_0005754959 /DNA_START=229 /DNA_END=456 /DNA_ORIENTATION=+